MNTLFKPVTVYTQPLCKPCDRVKKKLKEANIDFEEVNILENEEAYSYVKNVLKARSTPVVVSDVYEPILGYEPTQLKDLILLVNADKIYDATYDEVDY